MARTLLLALVALVGLSGLSVASGAEPAKESWRTLDTPVALNTKDKNKVEVVELFWYGCPHCYDLEPMLAAWVKDKPDYIEFVRVPAILDQTWVPLARAFYTIQVLELPPGIHQALFDAIHRDKRNLNLVGEMEGFFAAHGVDKEKFRETYDSFSVDTLVRKAAKLTKDYRITGVPSLVVNGRYVTSSGQAGGHDALLSTVGQLAEREHKNSAAAAK